MRNSRLIFIPFIILLYFFIHFTTDYYFFLKPSFVSVTFIKYIIITGALYFGVNKIFKNKEKYTLAFSTILFIYLFFGSLTDTVFKYKVFTPVTNIYLNLIIIFLIFI